MYYEKCGLYSRTMKLIVLVILFALASCTCYAQFSGSVQGVVLDTSKAAIAGATVTLVNIDTKVTQTTTSTFSGNYLFISLPPGNYTAEAIKQGFQSAIVPVLLETGQLRNVPIVLSVGAVTSNIIVSTQAPLLDTSDSRSQLTLNSKELESLPNSTLNAFSSLDLTPGVTGNASGQQNFNLQAGIAIGAGGRGENGNTIVIDGISTGDSTRGGTTDLSPDLDAIQEVSTQTNTYSVLNAASSSILIQLTTKPGTEKYHGSASEYYQYQGLNARGEYGIPQPTPQAKYHTDNISLTLGGPVPKVKQLFFFVAYNPYLQLNPTSAARVSVTNPSFISTYLTRAGNPSPEVKQILQPYNLASSKFVPQDQTNPNNYETAAQVFDSGNCPASGFLGTNDLGVPCGAIVDEYGYFNSAGSTNAAEYSVRIDKVFRQDRLYGSFFRSTETQLSPALVPAQATQGNYTEYALQGDETHTFSPRMLNEVTIGATNINGLYGESDYYYNPVIGIGGLNGYGAGGAGHYVIDTQRYRDLVTYVHGDHTISAGGDIVRTANPSYEASYGAVPHFGFNNLYDLANDLPDSESNLSYNLLTGAISPYQYSYGTKTFDLFAEDVWRVTHRLTINYGIRYDNYGNPYPLTVHAAETSQTELTNLQLAQGQSFQAQIENSALVSSGHIFAHDLNWNFGPRVGFAYGVGGNGKWVIRGGFGLYHDWFNLGASANALAGNPPNDYFPTFIRGVTATTPVFSVGTGNTYPYGYTHPNTAGTVLNAKGGIPGSFVGIGAMDRNLRSPATMNWSLGLEHQLLPKLTASVLYAGSHSYDQVYGGQSQGAAAFGVDVNVYDGDTVAHPIFNSNGTWERAQQERLNTSFGQITYNFNGGRGNYGSVVVAVRGRFGTNGFVDVSYTRADTKDDWAQYYNGYQSNGSWNANDQYGPSNLDIRNRTSVGASYQFHAFTHGNGILRKVFSGYQISTLGRFQTGAPTTVSDGNGLNLIDTVMGVQLTSANYASELAAGHITYISMANLNNPNVRAAIAAGSLANNAISGDFLADGNNTSVPNASSYTQVRNRKAYQYKCPVSQSGCSGSIQSSQFSTPAFATGGTQGNERWQAFRQPGYGDVDVALEKNTLIWKEITLRLRADFFNAFNRSNWNGIDNNLADFSTTFGTTQGTGPARVGQLSAKITF